MGRKVCALQIFFLLFEALKVNRKIPTLVNALSLFVHISFRVVKSDLLTFLQVAYVIRDSTESFKLAQTDTATLLHL